MTVTLRLDARTHDGGHASASYTITAPTKHDVYQQMAVAIQSFAEQHGVPPSSVQQSSTWMT